MDFQDNNSGAEQGSDEIRLGILASLSQSITSKRDEAVSARASCGIETEWTGDEEFYQGYDDANRNEFVNTTAKPTANGGTSELTKGQKETQGSTVFPNISQPYVDAAAARVGDMLLPTDDRNFVVDPTPIPEPTEAFGIALKPVAAAAAQAAQPADPAAQLAAELKDRFEKIKQQATEKAEKAQTRIDDWLKECQYHAEMRTVIDDAAKLGTGVIKGPVPIKKKATKWVRNEQTGETMLEVFEKIQPGSRRIDVWNLYPDYPACGDNIHNGSFIFEHDQISERKLRDLKGLPGYIDSQIDECMKEGPKNSYYTGSKQQLDRQSGAKSLYDIWYYHGDIKAEELKACGCQIEEKDSRESFPVMLTIVNDRVVRASLNPLDNGEFPYDIIPWKRRPGMPWGMGVARQIRTAQRIVTGATRRLMDNAGFASGPLITIRRGVHPEDGVYGVYPLKIFIEDEDSAGGATDPVKATVIPILINELMAIINFGMKMAEDVTGLPMLLQGQQGKAPDTVGGMTILNNNANSVLRRVARLFDSSITEPHITRYYAWLMAYGEYDEEKGDFQIVARGSSALVERDIQSQEMVNILTLCSNPIYKKNPAKAIDEYLKSRRFNPKTFDYTDEELEAMSKQPPPEDPRITAAKITSQATVQRAQMDAKETNDRLMAEARMRLNEQNFDAAQAAMDREFEERLADKNLSSEERQHLETQKVALAKVTLQMRTQMNLSAQRNAAPQVATPPTEPAGRAPDGMAFQR